jgi:hypothetical protein
MNLNDLLSTQMFDAIFIIFGSIFHGAISSVASNNLLIIAITLMLSLVIISRISYEVMRIGGFSIG